MQYPRVAEAVRADMQNLGMILRLMKRIAPGIDVKATAEEIRSRIHEELDYELEASNQRSLARIFRGHPFIVVPEVMTELSRERVLVNEFVRGRGFDDIKQLDQATRDRVGEIVFRFFFGCMYRHRQFSGDPHPGNFLLQDDGRVAFLDFGLFKRMPQELIDIELACQRAGHEGDAERLHAIFAETGFLREPDKFRPDKLLAQFRDATWWYVLDEEVQLEPEIATQVMIDMSDPRSQHFGQMRHETLPADHLFGRRVEMLTLAVLSQLRACNNWHRIAREWMYGEAPGHRARARRGGVLRARGGLEARPGGARRAVFTQRARRLAGSFLQAFTDLRRLRRRRRRRLELGDLLDAEVGDVGDARRGAADRGLREDDDADVAEGRVQDDRPVLRGGQPGVDDRARRGHGRPRPIRASRRPPRTPRPCRSPG